MVHVNVSLPLYEDDMKFLGANHQVGGENYEGNELNNTFI